MSRRTLSVLLVVPVAALLVHGAIDAAVGDTRSELPCWVLPNLRVMSFPTNPSCPLGALGSVGHATVDGSVRSLGSIERLLELTASRIGGSLRTSGLSEQRDRWVEMPIHGVSRSTRMVRVAGALLGSMLLLGMPLLLLLRTTVSSAVPLGILYSSLSIVLIAASVGQHSETMTRLALASLPVAPAAVMHLSFSFPRERKVVREAPLVVAAPYVLALFLVAAGYLAIDVAPSLWPSYLTVLVAVAGGSWLALITSCGYALRESESNLERASARLVFFGALMVPLLPWLASLPGARTPGEAWVFYLWCAAVTMPLPIALAITRYNLFELGWEARGAFSRVVFLVFGAGLIGLVFALTLRMTAGSSVELQAAPLFLVGAICIVALEPLRSRIPALFEEFVTPRLKRLRRARQHMRDELHSAQDEEGIGHALGQTLQDALRPRAGCIVLGDHRMNRIVHLFGDAPPTETETITSAFHALAEEDIVYLPARPEVAGSFPELARSRIEATLSIGDTAGRYGLVLLGPSAARAAYMGVELEFAADLCGIAAGHLRSALATRGLLASERQAAAGRLAVWLAHDVLKDLGWMRRLLRRLRDRSHHPERFERDVQMLLDLSEEVVEAVQRVVAEADGRHSAEQPPFDDVIGTAVRRIEGIHGPGRISESIEPGLRGRPCSPHLSRAVSNLLDNALHASPNGETVHLQATSDGEVIHITIDDRGCGVPEERLERVFEPGVSERLGCGGSGLGLPVAREIAESLGGNVRLERGRTRGTRAVIELPSKLGVAA